MTAAVDGVMIAAVGVERAVEGRVRAASIERLGRFEKKCFRTEFATKDGTNRNAFV